MTIKKPVVFALCSWFPNRLDPTLGNFVEDYLNLLGPDVDGYGLFLTSDPSVNRTQREDTLLSGGWKMRRVYVPYMAFGLLRKWKRSRQWLQEAEELIRQHKPDCIHVHASIPALLIALRLKAKWRIPVLLTEHWTGYLPNQSIRLSMWHRMLIKRSWPKVDHITAVSDYLAQSMKTLVPEIDVQVIPNAIKSGFFEQQRKPSSSPQFLHVSNGTAQKQVLWLVRFFEAWSASIPTARLIVVGEDGPEKLAAREWLRNQPNSAAIQWRGLVSEHELVELMQTSTALLHPSDYETQGLTVYEALAGGLPVVAQPLPVFDPIRSRIICPEEKSFAAWGKALNALIQNPPTSITIPDTFHPTYVRERWLSLYKKYIAK